jgi:hypothetical protein
MPAAAAVTTMAYTRTGGGAAVAHVPIACVRVEVEVGGRVASAVAATEQLGGSEVADGLHLDRC